MQGGEHFKAGYKAFAVRAANAVCNSNSIFKLFSCIAFSTLICGLDARADADSHGTADRFSIPIPSPSFDTTPREFTIGGQTYSIPRNYIGTIEGVHGAEVRAISMGALLPDLTGLTPANVHCFTDVRDPCQADSMIIGLTEGANWPGGSKRLQNMSGLIHPDKRNGPCGLEYYEARGSVQLGQIVSDYYVKKFPDNSDFSLLRCVKEGSPGAPVCNIHENLGDGNSYYYIFNRTKLCEWESIRARVLALIRSFKRGGEK